MSFPIRRTCGLVLASLVATTALSTSAGAQEYRSRDLSIGASAACVPFFSTTQARYSSTGMRNSGTATFYASCSAQAGYDGYRNAGATGVDVSVANRGATAITVNCTLRPGWVNGSATSQGAFPKSRTIAPGDQYWFGWTREELWPTDPAQYIANPNFTCTLPVGGEITHLNIRTSEDVGN